jgi:antitoxin component of MazEF toxin-antitoxin module
MVKRLTKTGNSLALVLDRPLLETTGIKSDTPLEVSTIGDVIVITPLRSRSRKTRFQGAVEAVNDQYAGVFQRLADS